MLEPRRLLTVAVSSGVQDGVDLVETDASVGPDGVDNGGNLSGGADIGLRLWDAGRRRQPPAPAGKE